MSSIGIDLGTSNCCVSVFKNGKVEVIENDEGARTTPSYVYFGKTETLYGHAAKNKCSVRPENTIYDVKRFLGKKFNDSSLEPFKNKWAFKLEEVKGRLKVFVNGTHFDPEEISGRLLRILKQRAEKRLAYNAERAVITVPTYFNIVQRQATIDAGKLAGFKEVKLLTEPTAAALAYNADVYHDVDKVKTIFVFDFGGGTFDVSIVEMQRGSVKVLAIDGDVNLGGNDITLNLLNYMSSVIPTVEEHVSYLNNTSVDANDKKYATSLRYYMRFFEQCEDWKKELSDTNEVESDFEGVDIKITRAKFEELNEKLFSRMIKIVRKCFKKIKLKRDQIDEVLLIGGSTKIPLLQQKLEKLFGSKLSQGINADEAVAIGAAMMASKWDGNEEFSNFDFVDLCPYNLGVETREINGVKGEHLMDVVIPKHSQLPAKHTRPYANPKDMQSVMKFPIYSGDDDKSTLNNILIGSISVTGFPPGPAYSVQVEVTFIYDDNGTLQVEAVEKTSGTPHTLTIKLDVAN